MLLPEKSNKNSSDLSLPDIARESRVDLTGKIDRVGMTEIEIPVLIKEESGVIVRTSARADAFVSLDDPFAKGIHMSRLFLQLQEALTQQPLTYTLLQDTLKLFVATHVDISESSQIRIRFDYMVQRPALKSQNWGWRSYPVVVSGTLTKGVFSFELDVEVLYSSTCPCSAALARKLIQDEFRKKFLGTSTEVETVYEWLGSTEGILATPHSQRSVAEVKVKFTDPGHAPKFIDLIDLVEKKLGTPVQAAVKREDEQEFAFLNGQNLMFCEDAGRKIKNALMDKPFCQDFWIKVSHLESLHPHNAVSILTKGVKGGYQP